MESLFLILCTEENTYGLTCVLVLRLTEPIERTIDRQQDKNKLNNLLVVNI